MTNATKGVKLSQVIEQANSWIELEVSNFNVQQDKVGLDGRLMKHQLKIACMIPDGTEFAGRLVNIFLRPMDNHIFDQNTGDLQNESWVNVKTAEPATGLRVRFYGRLREGKPVADRTNPGQTITFVNAYLAPNEKMYFLMPGETVNAGEIVKS